MAEWNQVQQLRQAVRDAPNLPTRVEAIAAYDGALHTFIDRYHHLIDHALTALAVNDP